MKSKITKIPRREIKKKSIISGTDIYVFLVSIYNWIINAPLYPRNLMH